MQQLPAETEELPLSIYEQLGLDDHYLQRCQCSSEKDTKGRKGLTIPEESFTARIRTGAKSSKRGCENRL